MNALPCTRQPILRNIVLLTLGSLMWLASPRSVHAQALPPVPGAPDSAVTSQALPSAPSPTLSPALPAVLPASTAAPALPVPGPSPTAALPPPTATPTPAAAADASSATVSGSPSILPPRETARALLPPVPVQPARFSSFPASRAALPRPANPLNSLFRIGFLRPAAESPLDWQWYQNLRRALLEDKNFTAALREAGFSDVALRPCDGPEDMAQRMDQSEFELAFCPTMVYVQLRAARPRDYIYHAFLHPRGPYWDSRGDEYVRQKGVLFVRRGSALDVPGKNPGVDEIKRTLASRYMAVSSRYDAAGYFDIRKLLWDNYNKTSPGELLYCGSPQEVVKAVVTGLCDIGSCEESVLKEVFSTLPKSDAVLTGFREGANAFVRILDTSNGVPTNPVVIREEYNPYATDSSLSPLGVTLTEVLKRVYRKAEKGIPVLDKTNDEDYSAIVEDFQRLQGVVVW